MGRSSMFSRLLTIFLVAILSCAVILFAISYMNLRNARIESRMNALKTQARDMAYLAGRLPSDSISRAFGNTSATEQYMYWKANRVYTEYNAYILVVDRSGQHRTYYNETTLKDESLQFLPTQEEIARYLEKVMRGEEVVVQSQSTAGPLFTVLVPISVENAFDEQRTVTGLVLIQTAAQTVHASYKGLAWQMALAVGLLVAAAGILVFFLTRHMTRPLTIMAQAAGNMAKGDFNARAPEEGTQEIRELARSFNQMADQLASLEQSRRDFVANVSHELRSPITSIQGFAQGMLDGTIAPEEHEKYLQVVVDETHRLSKLIAGLLNLSRMENEETSLAYSDFDVNETARRVIISRINPIDEKQLEVNADFEIDPCFVHADADQIEQVIINLLDNAIKFTPQGGTITLTTRENGQQVLLQVKDNGEGVLPDDVPHIFDRFYKADKAHTVGKGTGLGLAICRRIMEKHGQTIRLVSGEGGAEFEITLAKGKQPGGTHGDSGTSQD